MTIIQKKIPMVLQNIQILYQNEDIDNATKEHLVRLLQEARKTNDTSELHKVIKGMRYGTTMPNIVDQLMQLTTPSQ